MSGYRRPEPASQFEQLTPLLAQVSTPVQYVGGEINAQHKAWDDARVHWALLFPDTYGVGQPNQGMAILYEVLNELDWASAERSFSVWPDLERLMRAKGVGQFTLESHRRVSGYDVIGVSLSTELSYTNLLNALDLAGLPIHSAERDDDAPLVVVGGHCAFNPEPIADFVDVVVLGDGEEASLELSRIVRDWLDEGRPGGRVGVLERLAHTGMFYVPRFYQVDYAPDATISRIAPVRADIPATINCWVLTGLDDWPYPKAPVVPMAETVHERYSVEIFRGCTRGCRFCQAGMITRPVRERSVQTIESMVDRGLAATGLEEVGLLSLSSADHSEIDQIAGGLADRYAGTNTSLSLPSTRVDAFNVQLAQELSRNGRRTGLTIAPEAGSERMRAVINKNVSQADLMATVTAAFEQGWRSVKMYFMCGLPTETDDDVAAIARLAKQVVARGREISGSRDIRCTVSIGGFVPKSHTPFEWAPQATPEVIDHRIAIVKDAIREDRQFRKSITVRYSAGEPGQVEGLLARGDRRVGRVVEAVWRAGGRFDGWSEYFDYELWTRCAAEQLAPFGIDLEWFTTRERPQVEVLAWDHLDSGLDRTWLWDEYRSAIAGDQLADCRWDDCNDCGVCPLFGVDIELATEGQRPSSQQAAS
ncbi:Fe-S oxidoreductases family 2 [Propionibacterium freudenreichii subsp. freudenreichii]|uniref:Fe-S oxidoreductases family 2 n=1 Tax=Propionibacterium freudenreichii subsp. freudenreichii TaxID=66712 RepID=A0A0B7P0Q0_PROFF|nr:Fe-S oxidoreductases family 2 [Propionibacterium freudenreichii subsp. freudenreichii]